MSQHDIEWNQTKQEWICKRCQLASDHVSKLDAEHELSQFDCVKSGEQDAD
jgi:hypothetical protein